MAIGHSKKGYREMNPLLQTWRKPNDPVVLALLAKQGNMALNVTMPEANPEESWNEASKRILIRFGILEEFAEQSTRGECRAMIVSGPPGLGKSFTVERVLKGMDEGSYSLLKGYVKTTGLIRKLYEHRHPGHLVVFDDCDMIFRDENSLNLLKAVCDTCEDRTVTYMTEKDMVSETDADIIPKTFSFEGSVIFLTNMDFDAMIAKGHMLSEHLAALVSRSHYIDLTMKSKRDFVIRIQQVLKEGMLDKILPDQEHQDEVYSWICDNQTRVRELSLRFAIKLAGIRKSMPHKWQDIAEVTCCKV